MRAAESFVGDLADLKQLRTLAEPKGYNVESVSNVEGNADARVTYSVYPKGVSAKWGEHFPSAAKARDYISTFKEV